jgi:hypothetical protein
MATNFSVQLLGTSKTFIRIKFHPKAYSSRHPFIFFSPSDITILWRVVGNDHLACFHYQIQIVNTCVKAREKGGGVNFIVKGRNVCHFHHSTQNSPWLLSILYLEDYEEEDEKDIDSHLLCVHFYLRSFYISSVTFPRYVLSHLFALSLLLDISLCLFIPASCCSW